MRQLRLEHEQMEQSKAVLEEQQKEYEEVKTQIRDIRQKANAH